MTCSPSSSHTCRSPSLAWILVVLDSARIHQSSRYRSIPTTQWCRSTAPWADSRFFPLKEFRVDGSMMGRHAPESYRTTKRGQTSIPEKPPRGIGRFLLGRKNVSKKMAWELCGGAGADKDWVRPPGRRREVPPLSHPRRRGRPRLWSSR